jgi:hypothetical protein
MAQSQTPKVYTARNTREQCGDIIGTVPQNILARILSEYSDAVARLEVVGVSPYRWEPQHSRRQKKIDEQNGIPQDPAEIASKIEEHGTKRSVVYLDSSGETQTIKFRTLITDYELEIDTDIVVF